MSHNQKEKKEIIIDQEKGLTFSSEDDLYEYFRSEIKKLESEFFKLRSFSRDIKEKDFSKFDKHLDDVLESPDEIWTDKDSLKDRKLAIYIKDFTNLEDKKNLFHVALTYLSQNVPSFVYLHFPTNDKKLIEKYRRGQKIYNKSFNDTPPGALDGDALYDGHKLAMGLYKSMNKLRSHKDIKEEDFFKYAHLREPTIEEADEIWRNNDSMGNILVRFIKEHSVENNQDIFYIVVTAEDPYTNSHTLLFSFPTKDQGLISRYRSGENLRADGVIRESSH